MKLRHRGPSDQQVARKLIRNALVNINGDNIVTSAGAVVSMKNQGTGNVETYGDLPGSATDSFSTPDSAAASVTGDIDIRVRASLDDWTPADENAFISKWEGTGTLRSYMLRSDDSSTGKLELLISDNGTNTSIGTSDAAVSFSDGVVGWIRVTIDLSENDVKFYTSTETHNDPDAVTWTQLGTTVGLDTPAASISDRSSQVEVGSRETSSTDNLAGKVYRAAVYDGIDGTKVLDFIPSDYEYGTTFTSSTTGEVWTIVDEASIPTYYDLNTVVGTGANMKEGPSGAALLYGASGDNLDTPDSASISIVGDITILGRAAFDDPTPASVYALTGKYGSTSLRSYNLRLSADGKLQMESSPDGSAGNQVLGISTIALPAVAETPIWYKCEFDVNDGGGNRVYIFSYSTDTTNDPDSVTWTQLGTTVTTAGATTISDNASDLEVGSLFGGTLQRLFGSVYRAQVYSGSTQAGGTLVADMNPIDQTDPDGTTFNSDLMAIDLPGGGTDGGTTPSAAVNQITGTLTLLSYVAATDWTPAAISAIVSKYLNTGGQRGYGLLVNTDGTLQSYISPDGNASVTANSSAATGFTNGTAHWVKSVFDDTADTAQFYTSDDPINTPVTSITWTELGTVQAQVSAGIHPSTTQVEIGGWAATAAPFTGAVYRAQIYSGIQGSGGTLAVDFNAADFVTGATLTSSATGEVWTANGNSAFTGQWTQNGNCFIQNTGHTVIHSIGSVSLEPTAAIDLTLPLTVFAVARFSDASRGATTQQLLAPKASAVKQFSLMSNATANNNFTFYNGTAISLTEVFDNDPHVWTAQGTGGADAKLTVGGVGSVTGNAGSQTWEYATLFADRSGANTMPGYVSQLLVFDCQLNETDINAVQTYLASKYGV